MEPGVNENFVAKKEDRNDIPMLNVFNDKQLDFFKVQQFVFLIFHIFRSFRMKEMEDPQIQFFIKN